MVPKTFSAVLLRRRRFRGGHCPRGAPLLSAVGPVQLPLSASAWATLEAPFPLDEAAWDQMISVLQAMKPGLTKPREPDLGERARNGSSEGD